MQSLLFCPDEKCARALTALVEGLDILVKRETEVYAAMRTLMAESFDFLIIDCEDEPTGRLLLRNAHGSEANKEVLSVAIVLPEGGANALRFGADFLITKPVIAAQAGKVLRLVRSSVLRKPQSSPPAARTEEVKPEAPSSSNLELATAVTRPPLEHAVEASSDHQGAMSSAPAVELETARIATNPGMEGNEEGEDSPKCSEAQVALELEALDPTSVGVESAPPETVIAESERADPVAPAKIKKTRRRLVTVSLGAALAVVLLVADVMVWRVGFKHSWNDGRALVPSSTPRSNTIGNESLSGGSQTVAAQASRESGTEAAPMQVESSGPSLEVQLMTATITVNSNPPAAALWMDGRDTGRITPTNIVVQQAGSHTFVFKKAGYLDETIATNLRLGETSRLAPSLRILGRTDDIRMVSRFRKMFGHSGPAEMGTVKVSTQPKGAQIAVNSRILGKTSPSEFYLNPGNYVIEMTLSGFKTAHRVVSVDKGGQVAIDEVMDHE